MLTICATDFWSTCWMFRFVRKEWQNRSTPSARGRGLRLKDRFQIVVRGQCHIQYNKKQNKFYKSKPLYLYDLFLRTCTCIVAGTPLFFSLSLFFPSHREKQVSRDEESTVSHREKRDDDDERSWLWDKEEEKKIKKKPYNIISFWPHEKSERGPVIVII